MEKIKEIFKPETIIILILLLAVIIGEGIIIFQKNGNSSMNTLEQEILTKENEEEAERPKIFYVDIKGEVQKPGIYQVVDTERVDKVIELAGGLTKNASTEATNLSLRVFDEMVIIIYSKNEIKNFKETKKEEVLVSAGCNNANIKNDSCITSNTESSTGLISINTGTQTELMTLPGIGEAKAISIIEYRKSHGNFLKIEDIKNVSGIGDSVYDQIKNLITI